MPLGMSIMFGDHLIILIVDVADLKICGIGQDINMKEWAAPILFVKHLFIRYHVPSIKWDTVQSVSRIHDDEGYVVMAVLNTFVDFLTSCLNSDF
ncbi:unnamed protein product [Caenorhabditis brenneri]